MGQGRRNAWSREELAALIQELEAGLDAARQAAEALLGDARRADVRHHVALAVGHLTAAHALLDAAGDGEPTGRGYLRGDLAG